MEALTSELKSVSNDELQRRFDDMAEAVAARESVGRPEESAIYREIMNTIAAEMEERKFRTHG